MYVSIGEAVRYNLSNCQSVEAVSFAPRNAKLIIGKNYLRMNLQNR